MPVTKSYMNMFYACLEEHEGYPLFGMPTQHKIYMNLEENNKSMWYKSKILVLLIIYCF